MAITRLPDNPNVAGNRWRAVVAFDGPASYTQGTGTVITAQSCGFKHIEFISACLSDNGTYEILPKFTTKGLVTQVNLLWYTKSTGAEVSGATDLSARFSRAQALGVAN